jgi:hypothetical protein
VYLIDPPEPEELRQRARPRNRLSLKIESLVRRLRRKPHVAEELFTGAMEEAILFVDLLRKVGGDRSAAERLVEYERQKKPGATRLACLRNAVSRWEQENR